jgi:hypothetical protein
MNHSHLFHAAWTREALRDVLARHPAKPLLPVLGAEPWRAAAAKPLVQELVAPLRKLAEQEAGQPLPVLTDELYADFCKTGTRLTFERVYFERRRRLARAAICLLLAEESDPVRERLVASVREKFQDIFEEVSWALPAHVNWQSNDRSGKEPMQIDLFCAETSNLMAETLDVFGEIIPSGLQARVRERLQRMVFENYLSRDFPWMEKTSNWNAVCHQGVMGAALSQVNDPEFLAAMLFRMRTNLPRFLEGYGPDGGCSEGAGYWDYGFGWYAALNAQLERRTDGELSLFDGDELVRSIALYGPRACLSNGHLVNFADGSASGGLDPALLTYLGERLGEPSCAAAAAENFRRLQREGVPLDRTRTDFFHLSRWMLACPAGVPSGTFSPPDHYFPDLAVLVARGTDAAGRLWEFAAKGGHNGEHHNHNDCGGFLLNIEGRRRIVEIGAPEYVHDFFQPAKRYNFLAARSLGHSVPLVNGCEQNPGAEFAARVLNAQCGGNLVEFVADLAGCYPSQAKCRRLRRTFVWDKTAGRLTVSDQFELEEPGPVESMLICLEEPASHEGLVAVDGLQIQLSPGTRYLGSERCPYRSHVGEDAFVYRLRFAPESGPVSSGQIEFTLSALG